MVDLDLGTDLDSSVCYITSNFLVAPQFKFSLLLGLFAAGLFEGSS